MRRSITSGASARRGNGARIAQRIRAKPTPSAPSCSIRVGRRGLQGLESVSHVVVLYWMDRARRDLVLQAPHHYSRAPRHVRAALAGAAQPDRGLGGAARCASREMTLSVVGLDCLDDTPLLDIKPYFASTDSVPDASVGWHAGIKR